jgi:hypothetical protein
MGTVSGPAGYVYIYMYTYIYILILVMVNTSGTPVKPKAGCFMDVHSRSCLLALPAFEIGPSPGAQHPGLLRSRKLLA